MTTKRILTTKNSRTIWIDRYKITRDPLFWLCKIRDPLYLRTSILISKHNK